jgi:hypothetical protein
MALDRNDKRWLVGTAVAAAVAVAVYAALSASAPAGLTGGSGVGLWYGLLGTALVVVAAGLWLVRRLPVTWAVASRPTWLRAHVWLGLLSAVLLLCHSGLRWGGPLERLLWLVTAGVLLTGVAGLLLQRGIPRLLAARVPCEAAPGQVDHACRLLRRRGDALVDQACGTFNPLGSSSVSRSPDDPRRQLRGFYEAEVRPFLGRQVPRRAVLADPLRAAGLFGRLQGMTALAPVRPHLEQLAGLCEERRLLAAQAQLSLWLHAWLLLHVPLAVALLVFAAAHALFSLYY